MPFRVGIGRNIFNLWPLFYLGASALFGLGLVASAHARAIDISGPPGLIEHLLPSQRSILTLGHALNRRSALVTSETCDVTFVMVSSFKFPLSPGEPNPENAALDVVYSLFAVIRIANNDRELIDINNRMLHQTQPSLQFLVNGEWVFDFEFYPDQLSLKRAKKTSVDGTVQFDCQF